MLFNDEEIAYLLNPLAGGKGFSWNTRECDIGSDRIYYGQYKTTAKKGKQETWSGLGVIRFKDGGIYRGETKNGHFEGKGQMEYPDGDIYTGQWKDGKANGFGTFFSEQGVHYEGEWLDDQFHGQGVEYFEFDKGKYSGGFQHGKKSGHGRFDMDGVTYEGEFLDGQFHG